MKSYFKFNILSVLLALTVSVGFAQTFPPTLNGSMTPYNFSLSDPDVPWKPDKHPVFIGYVSRHGARFLSSEKKVSNLLKNLSESKDKEGLTEKGYQFLSLLERVDSVTAGKWGALNATGIEEEQILADQMKKIAPDLLKEGRVEAISTYVPRVVMTMYQLTHRLIELSPQLEIYTSEGHQYDSLLRFFHTDTAYQDYLENGIWNEAYDRFVTKNIPAAPAQSLFSTTKDKKELQKLTLDMYGVLQSLPAAGIEWNPEIWFEEDQYRHCWEAANLKHYLQRSVNPCSSLAASAAVPLLNNIIEQIDKNTSGNSITTKNAINMWFGHAETVMPLFALMRLPGCYAPDCKPEEVASVWKDWEVSPLGANLMIVVLTDAAGKKSVALRLNGKWVELKDGHKTAEWETLKKEWRNNCCHTYHL